MEFWEGERCEYCAGIIVEKKADVSRKVKGKYVLIENVPTGVCTECGTRYYAARSGSVPIQVARQAVLNMLRFHAWTEVQRNRVTKCLTITRVSRTSSAMRHAAIAKLYLSC